MKNSYFLYIILTLSLMCLNSGNTYSQQLVQSFIEANITGSSKFGYSVSDAGDVNNDGYNDVIVGAYNYSSSTGKAYIYYGGSSMDNTADVTMTGETTNNNFGFSVSGAGDVNNDGYDDVIVGAYYYNSYQGRAYIYYGGSDMDATVDVTMTGGGANYYFGYSVSGAGDVNNDGYDDVIVGAYYYNSYQGCAYIYYGGSSMDNTADVTMTGGGTNYYFGYSVSGAGDVNNDGYDDVIVGAYGYSSNTGRAYIYYGGSSMDNTADVTMTGEFSSNYFGYSVSGAGDVNNDGYDDVIAGAYGYSSNTGRAYIYYGGNPMNNIADVTMTGETTSNYFGRSVSSTGDVNSDGYDDVIVGADGYNSFRGRAYIYYGGNPMNSVADLTLTGEAINNSFGNSVSGAGDLNNDGYGDVIVGAYVSRGRTYVYYGSSSMDNTADVTMTGEATDNSFGCSVSNAGDVNNDGYDDIIVGATGYNASTGKVYIYYGGSSIDNTADVTMTGDATNYFFGMSVSGAGDVNNDGYADVIVGCSRYNSNQGRAYIYYGGSSMDNIADVIMTGELAGDYFGCFVSGAGDVNHDGYDDVIVGAYGYSSNTGRAYIYYGGSNMDNTADVTLTGEVTSNYFGYSVSRAGDVNNDSYADVIVGAYGYSTNTGRAYIYYGGNSMDATADVTMTGAAMYSYFSLSVSDAGDVNNDGYDDVIVGSYYYNSYTGRAYIYYGGNPMNNTADVTMTGETTSNYFGYSVSGAGDVNNDGYADVIVGAYYYNTQTGRAYIYYGGNPMNSTADVTMTGEVTKNNFACSVSGAGDVNGDGYDDVIVGAFSYPTNGKVYIYSDNLAPMPIELISFTALKSQKNVQLNWQTATEVNNYGFEVERKSNDKSQMSDEWKKIGFVEGYGNSNSPKEYKYVDANPFNGTVKYRLKQIDNDGSFCYSPEVEVEMENILTKFALYQNYPNPFSAKRGSASGGNPFTRIQFQVPSVSQVTLKVYDILGKEIATLVDEEKPAGIYAIHFDGSSLSSGIYFYQLTAGSSKGQAFVQTLKMTIIK